jgi:DNA (cytosine-5)-methyltransferase 1
VNLGYKVEHRELRAATTARRPSASACSSSRAATGSRSCGRSRRTPRPGKGLKPWRTAAECIEWSACPSIFEREKPLAEATLRRIAHGIQRYVIDNPKPFIVPVTHTSSGDSNGRASTSRCAPSRPRAVASSRCAPRP